MVCVKEPRRQAPDSVRQPPTFAADFGALALPFLADCAAMTAIIGFPLAAIRLGASPQQLGMLGAASPLAFVLSCLSVGHLSDRWPRRQVIAAGALAYGLAFLIASAARSVSALTMTAAVVGLAGGLFWPAVEAAIADAYGHGPLGRGLLLFNIGWTCGMSLGAWTGGRLADVAPSLPFAAAAGITLPMLLMVATWPMSRRTEAGVHPAEGAPGPAQADDLFLLFARIANCGTFFGLACLRTLFPKLGTDLGFSGERIGVLLALTSFAQAVSFLPLARSRRWQYRLLPLLVTELAMALALFGVACSSSAPLFGVLLAVVGAGSGLTYLASLFYSLNRPTDRGRMGALHEAFLGSGAMMGPLLGGALAQRTSLRAPYLLSAAVIGIAIVVQLGLWARRRAMVAGGSPGAPKQ